MSMVSASGPVNTNDPDAAATAKRDTEAADRRKKKETERFSDLGMTQAQINEFYAQDEEINPDEVLDPVAEEKKQQTITDTERAIAASIKQNDAELRQAWDGRRSEDGPTYDDLTDVEKVD